MSPTRSALAIVIALVLGAIAGRWTAPTTTQSTASSPAQPAVDTAEALCAPPAESPSASPSAEPPDLVARARAGELDALKTLDEMPAEKRSVDDALALEAGHAALARADAETLVADVARDPKLLEDRGTLAYAYRLALDEAAAPTLLAGLSEIASPVVPDLLHDLASRGEPGARLTIFAQDLLAMPAVRARASKPLATLLALDAARDCGGTLALLARVEESADDRARAALARLRSESGCGPERTDDCMPCLRDASAKDALERATRAADARRFEPGWAVPNGKR